MTKKTYDYHIEAMSHGGREGNTVQEATFRWLWKDYQELRAAIAAHKVDILDKDGNPEGLPGDNKLWKKLEEQPA